MKNLFYPFTFVLISAAAACAQLSLESRLQEFRPAASEVEVAAHFKFKNIGSEPITITKVKTSCGCTTATFEKNTYDPGERGEIVARIAFGSRSGLQEKLITVETTDRKEPKVMLTLRVHIPETIQVKPTFLFWPRTQTAAAGFEPKAINLTAAEGYEVKDLKATTSDPNVNIEVKTLEMGKTYQLLVSPKSGHSPGSAIIKIQVNDPQESGREFLAHVRVQ
jgi:hypothetical protein